jgi:DNA sulfur modification protein DndB
VKSSLLIYQREEKTFEQIFERFNEVNFDINNKPWLNVVWNQIEKKMIMNSDSVTQFLLIYLYADNILTEEELKKLKEGYASKISYDQDVNNVLQGI